MASLDIHLRYIVSIGPPTPPLHLPPIRGLRRPEWLAGRFIPAPMEPHNFRCTPYNPKKLRPMLEGLHWLAQGDAIRGGAVPRTAVAGDSEPLNRPAMHEDKIQAQYSQAGNRQDPSGYGAVHTVERRGLDLLTRAYIPPAEFASPEPSMAYGASFGVASSSASSISSPASVISLATASPPAAFGGNSGEGTRTQTLESNVRSNQD